MRTGRGPQRSLDSRSPGPRGGREREPERTDFFARLRGALEDIGAFRCVAVRDLIDERFGGNRFAAARGVDRLRLRGLIVETQAHGRRGGAFRVLSLTAAGKRELERAAEDRAGPRQRWWAGAVKPAEAVHEAAVYRAAKEEARRLEARGCRVVRVVVDSEFKGAVARRSEAARARDGRRAADRERLQAARELDLPTRGGKVHYPDARLEYEDAHGQAGRVDVEVATNHYRAAQVAAKQACGFRVYAAGGRGRRLASLEGSGGGGGGFRDDEAFEL